MRLKYCYDFGKNLKEELKELDWNQRDFAKHAGITPAALSMLINGKREPLLSTLIKIVNALGVSFEDLVNGRKV